MTFRIICLSLVALLCTSLLRPDLLPPAGINIARATKWFFLVLFTLSFIGMVTPNTPEQENTFRKALRKTWASWFWRFAGMLADTALVVSLAAVAQYAWATVFLILIAFNRAAFARLKRELGMDEAATA